MNLRSLRKLVIRFSLISLYSLFSLRSLISQLSIFNLLSVSNKFLDTFYFCCNTKPYNSDNSENKSFICHFFDHIFSLFWQKVENFADFLQIFCRKICRLKNLLYLCTRNTAMVDSSKG